MKDEMTAQELGNLIGVTASRVRELTRQGVLARDGAGGVYVVARNVKSAFAHLRAGAAGRGGKAAAVVSVARARMITLQADRIEREGQKEAGKLIDAAEMEAALVRMMLYLQGAMMQIPKRLHGVDRRVRSEVERAVREVLSEAASAREIGGVRLRPPGDGGEGAPHPEVRPDGQHNPRYNRHSVASAKHASPPEEDVRLGGREDDRASCNANVVSPAPDGAR